jgi:cytochrome b subunit of formate dehydrogenase
VLLYAKRLVKASDKVVFLSSLIAAVSLSISGLVLNLPNQPGRTTLLASSLLVER